MMTALTSHSRRLLRIAGVAVAISVAAGCGSDDSSVAGFTQTSLVGNVAGKAINTDPNLVNSRGIARALIGGWMVANTGSGTATAYDGNGDPYPTSAGTVVTIPPGASSPVGALGAPSGVVANPSEAFVVTGASGSAPADFIFATLDGTIAGWSAAADPSTAVTVVDNSDLGAIYTGLAIGSNPTGGAFLYAASFRGNGIDVFDESFAPVVPSGDFRDTRLPTNYAPYGIQNIAGDIYVTYARQNQQKNGAVNGQGNGYVSVFDTEGNFIRRFTSQGQLNAPWGIAQAPASFSRFGGAFMISNAGNGQTNAFDPVSGRFLGQLQRQNGSALTIRGLWGIAFGNGDNAGSVDTLYFASGPAGGSEGLFGSVDPS